MREIKFRAWDKINKQMLPHRAISVLLKNVADNNQWAYMQYTGLKDKKRTEEFPDGQKIYEGDICKTHYWKEQPDGSMILSDKWKRYKNVVIEYSHKTPFVGFRIHEWYEVIGNIHENPELLKE